jgi:hypothetical protein
MLTSLDQARAAEDAAKHAYEQIRKTGDAQAIGAAYIRRNRATCQLQAAEAAADPQGYARVQQERDHQHAGAHAYGHYC